MDTHERLETRVVAGDARLRWRSPIGDSLHVLADPELVLQVLTKLIGNALEFTPEGGVVDVCAQRDASAVRFSVLDAGPGIPADELPRLFARAGLSGCKGLIEAHGGRLWADSLLGAGAGFNFTLPAAPAASPETAPA